MRIYRNPSKMTALMQISDNNNRFIKPILKCKSSNETTTATDLSVIKQKFMTTKDELILPWQQYASLPSQQNLIGQRQQQQSSSNDDYNELMQEIAKSHAFLTATHFEIMSFDEADKIQKVCLLLNNNNMIF